MNEELDILTTELCNELTKTNVNLGLVIGDYNKKTELSKYCLNELLDLIKIDRMFELKLIDNKQKVLLTSKYKEYISLKRKIDLSLININDTDKKVNTNDISRIKKLKIELNDSGLLENYNYKDAFVKVVDNNIKKKKINH